ncbi:MULTISPECIES: hypothetical protein [unclassified Pseudoxanthomonas]|uniref:LIC_13387 family protein n=1 Tax=unclassified Pseudoxanthomonas TaxID=2645906 RepID=UPI003078775F
MIATVLMVISAAVIFALGAAHLIFTFVGPKLTPRDPALKIRMSEVSPVITKEATMWSFWIGFNISHSMAAMLFGLIYGFLAIAHGGLLFSSPYLLIVGLLTVGGLFVVGKVYWFSGPFIGISISLACYIASVIVAVV